MGTMLASCSAGCGTTTSGFNRLSVFAKAIAAVVAFSGLLGATQPASAGFTQQGPKLVGTGGVGQSAQGFVVALSADGNTAVIGGPNDNNNFGAAWVFTRSGGVWSQQGTKLLPSDATGKQPEFGHSVAISADGNTALVGGAYDGGSSGAAWVFTRSGGVWNQQGPKLFGSGATGSALQGWTVALSGDGNTAMVGGPYDNNEFGAVWVFTRSGTAWSQLGSKLLPGDPAGNPFFASAIALSADGSTAVIGGSNDDSYLGATWIFTQSGGAWTQQGQKLVGSGYVNDVGANEGSAVGISSNGNTVIEGACCDNSFAGAFWIFARSGGVWSQQGAKFVGSGAGGSGSSQGSAVALSSDGNTAVEGGPGDNHYIGAVWVFKQSGGVWAQQGSKLIGSGATGTAEQGYSVALSTDGTTMVEGAQGDNSFTGAIWAFTASDDLAATHDFNGDGISDVLWRDTPSDIGIWLMNGTAILQTNVLGKVPSVWSAVGQRDFAGSGDAGILWRDTLGDVGLWLMNGTAIQQTAVLGNVPTSWSIAGTGDFNADGKADILWRDNLGNVGVWLMNGTTITQAAIIGKMPTSWVIAGADMDGDIFWRNTATGEVGMWVMNGTQIAQNVDFGAVPLSWTIAGIGDFAGTGSMDILWRDSSGNVGMWLMNGTTIASTMVLGNVPLNWSIAETGDYNGDGKSDILWVDNTGNVAVWFMNGAGVSSVATYGNVGTNWTVQSLNAD